MPQMCLCFARKVALAKLIGTRNEAVCDTVIIILILIILIIIIIIIIIVVKNKYNNGVGNYVDIKMSLIFIRYMSPRQENVTAPSVNLGVFSPPSLHYDNC